MTWVPPSVTGRGAASCVQGKQLISPTASGGDRELLVPCQEGVSSGGRGLWALIRKKCTTHAKSSALWKRTVSQVSSVRLKGSKARVYMNFWERGLPPCFLYFLFVCLFLGERGFVTNSVKRSVTLLPSPPVSIPTLICPFQRPFLAHHFAFFSWFCTRQVDRDLSICLRWLLPCFEEAAKAAEPVGHFPFFNLTAKGVLSPAESTLWNLWLSHLLYNRLGQEKRFFR